MAVGNIVLDDNDLILDLFKNVLGVVSIDGVFFGHVEKVGSILKEGQVLMSIVVARVCHNVLYGNA